MIAKDLAPVSGIRPFAIMRNPAATPASAISKGAGEPSAVNPRGACRGVAHHVSLLSQRPPSRTATRGKAKGARCENVSQTGRLAIEATIWLSPRTRAAAIVKRPSPRRCTNSHTGPWNPADLALPGAFHDREGFCTHFGDKILRDHEKPGRDADFRDFKGAGRRRR